MSRPVPVSGEAGSAAIEQEYADYSDNFQVFRSRLINDAGVPYVTFRKTLTPRYWLVWIHLGLGYLSLIAIFLFLIAIPKDSLGIGIAATLAASWPLGYVLAYISLFFHGASHYELSSNKARNDFCANILIGILFGYPMAEYRRVHFQHHRLLGQPEDPENGYIEPLNIVFILKSLTGVRFLQAVLVRQRGSTDRRKLSGWKIAGAVLHLAMVVACIALGRYALAAAWVSAFVVVAPTVMALRLVLEHRSIYAQASVDYRRTPHGAVARNFGDGPLASTLGGAGFNRHLLHHWDPQVSYTRLKDLENYLRTTELRDLLKKRSTTYAAIFHRLFEAF